MKKEKKEKHFIRKPIYEGGQSAMKRFIGENLKYPEEAKGNRIEGTVYVRYSIDNKGKVIATKVVSGIGYGCDEEAERLIRLLKFKVPRNRGVRAIFHKDLHIHFRLPRNQGTTLQYNYQPAKKEDSKKAEKGDQKEGGFEYTISW